MDDTKVSAAIRAEFDTLFERLNARSEFIQAMLELASVILEIDMIRDMPAAQRRTPEEQHRLRVLKRQHRSLSRWLRQEG